MAKKNDTNSIRSRAGTPLLQWSWTGSIFTATAVFLLGVLSVLSLVLYNSNPGFVLKIDATVFFILLSLISRTFEGVVTQVTEIKRYDVSNTSDGLKVTTSYRLLTTEGFLSDFWQAWGSGMGIRTQLRLWIPTFISVTSTAITAYAFKAAFQTGSGIKLENTIALRSIGNSTLLAEAHTYYNASSIGGLPSGNINSTESPLFWRDKDSKDGSTFIYFSNTVPNLPEILGFDQKFSIDRVGYLATTKCDATKGLTPDMQSRIWNANYTVQKSDTWLPEGSDTETNGTIAMEASPIDNTFRTYYISENKVRTCVTEIKGIKMNTIYIKDPGLAGVLITGAVKKSDDAEMSGFLKPAGNADLPIRMRDGCQSLLEVISRVASLRNSDVFKGSSSSVNSRIIACGLQAIVSTVVSNTKQLQYQRDNQGKTGDVTVNYDGIAFSSRWWMVPGGLLVLMIFSALGRLLQGAQRLNINMDRRWLVNVETAEQCLKLQEDDAADQPLEIRGRITDGVQHLVVTPADDGTYPRLTAGRSTL